MPIRDDDFPQLDAGAALAHPGPAHDNLSPAAFVELALNRGEAILTDTGALAACTGAFTGRSPKDRYLVPEPGREDAISWGSVNRAMDAAVFERLHGRVVAYLQGREVFSCDGAACADGRFHLPVRVIADKAWHALFAKCLLRDKSSPFSNVGNQLSLTILVASGMRADPAVDGTRSGVFIVLHLAKRLVLIGGTEYAGEIKKAVFSVLNYFLPFRDVLPMHCSANVDDKGDSALFFGLSGTGKTTLSADAGRRLIGDDEHGWSDAGIFNIEGGCYAKCARLSREGEPQIWNAIRFGSVLENVVVDPVTRRADFNDTRYTENTRAAYPLAHIDGVEPTGKASHPKSILFLACDAFGVLPPLSRLTPEQALYHFLSGYTAKIAGTETGVTEPEATFSTCFAAPFLPLYPTRYAEMLRERLTRHGSQVWLVNTGWTGGPYGTGSRIKLSHTRAMVRAILQGNLQEAKFAPDPVFRLNVPASCPGVPLTLLHPRDTWGDPAAYDKRATRLASLFESNFQAHASRVPQEIRDAGPRNY